MKVPHHWKIKVGAWLTAIVEHFRFVFLHRRDIIHWARIRTGILAWRRKRMLHPRAIARGSRGALAYSWLVIAVAGVLSMGMVAQAIPSMQFQSSLGPDKVEAPQLPESSVLFDVHGRRIATFYGEQNRISISRRSMPKTLRQAVLAIEDDDFYSHHGIRIGAIIRAAVANVTEGEVEQGGSTITQQYARNAFPEVGRGRTLSRKVKEAVYARELERRYTKDQILDRYLNTVYFGRGAYGVQAAARTFFGVPARALSLHQSALLAGVIHAPGRYVGDRKATKARRNLVLDRMTAEGFITTKRAGKAKALPVRYKDGTEKARAAYFVEHVRRLLRAPRKAGGFGLTNEQIYTGGLRIYTTLDLRMQAAAEDAVKKVLNRKDDPEAGMVAMTTDGQIRAMVGGRRFTDLEQARGFNYAAQVARTGGRQAGSAFKPFTLAAWLDDKRSPQQSFRAPSKIRIDDPSCRNADGSAWEPSNYGDDGYGSMRVIEATEKSVNTVYAQMVAKVGPKHAVKMARAAGITSPLEPVCSIALGTMGVTPLEVARAYATFAARGVRPAPLVVTKVVDREGTVIRRARVRTERTIARKVADQVNEILENVMEDGTGTPARISRPAAGKTGTTDSRRDVWFAGYTPHPGLSAAVWIGYPPNKNGKIKSMKSLHGVPATGGRFSGRIWRLFMTKALKGTPERSFADVSLRGGRRSGDGDRDRDRDSTWTSEPVQRDGDRRRKKRRD